MRDSLASKGSPLPVAGLKAVAGLYRLGEAPLGLRNLAPAVEGRCSALRAFACATKLGRAGLGQAVLGLAVLGLAVLGLAVLG